LASGAEGSADLTKKNINLLGRVNDCYKN